MSVGILAGRDFLLLQNFVFKVQLYAHYDKTALSCMAAASASQVGYPLASEDPRIGRYLRMGLGTNMLYAVSVIFMAARAFISARLADFAERVRNP